MVISRAVLESVSHAPGVYIFRDSFDRTLYVGKAIDLRRRVAQYFRGDGRGDGREQIPALLEEATALKTIVVHNELEALLLESNLIKLHQPKYNIMLRSDVSHACLHLNTDHPWPKLSMTRAHLVSALPGKCYGPYLSSYLAREMMEILQDIYGIRRCSDGELKRRERPCLWYHMNKCLAPCMTQSEEKVSGFQESYQRAVEGIDRALSGDLQSVTAYLDRRIAILSEALEFERAAEIVSKKKKLQRLFEQQFVDTPLCDENVDVLVTDMARNVALILSVRGGRVVDTRTFTWKLHGAFATLGQSRAFAPSALGHSDALVAGSGAGELDQMILQMYSEPESVEELDEIVLDASSSARTLIAAALKERFGRTLRVTSGHKSHRRQWLSIARSNLNALQQQSRIDQLVKATGSESVETCSSGQVDDSNHAPVEISDHDLNRVAGRPSSRSQVECARGLLELLDTMQERLRLNHFPRVIECFDISHLGGEETVGSCVVFVDGTRSGELSRRYKLDSSAGDDHAAMRQLLKRRIASLRKQQSLPQLWILDGGGSMLSLAKEILTSEDVLGVDVISISKESGKHTRGLTQEIIHTDEGSRLFRQSDPILLLLQRIRDAAHDVAITYQRQRRSQQLRRSRLDQVPGIGPKKKSLLIKHFGSVGSLKQSSQAELAKVSGLSKRDQENIAKYFGLQ